MNPLLKLLGAGILSLAFVGVVWFQAGLPFDRGPFPAWGLLAVLSLTTLIGTFDLNWRNLQRLIGVLLLLLALWTAMRLCNENAFRKSNLLGVLNQHGKLGVVCVGVGLVILAGGIDLSVGSLMGLSAVGFGVLMERGYSPIFAFGLVLLFGLIAGIAHGLLVTQLRLQAFLVTLCGMFIYRGLARSICGGGQTGIGSVTSARPEFGETLKELRFWMIGQQLDERLVFPAQLIVLLSLAAVVAVLLHRCAYGRYWYAIGYNPQAARYSGVNVTRQQVATFAICSLTAALAGVCMFLMNSVSPNDAGEGYELWAITAVVLGGVSLRGGEGTAIGIVLGAMVIPVVQPLMVFANLEDDWIPWMIGLILLLGTIADELIRRRSSG